MSGELSVATSFIMIRIYSHLCGAKRERSLAGGLVISLVFFKD